MKYNSRHRCLVYSGAPSEQLPSFGTTLIEKLDAGFRCLYLNSPAMVAGLRSYLAAEGLDIDEQTKRGALIITSDQSHLVKGKFEVEPMIAKLKEAVAQAEADGYEGLWASGDMTWEFGGAPNVGKLLDYECELEYLFQQLPGLEGICQYHMGTMPSASIAAALYTHQELFINQTLTRLNPNYLPPTEHRGRYPPTTYPQLNNMLERVGLPAYPAVF